MNIGGTLTKIADPLGIFPKGMAEKIGDPLGLFKEKKEKEEAGATSQAGPSSAVMDEFNKRQRALAALQAGRRISTGSQGASMGTNLGAVGY